MANSSWGVNDAEAVKLWSRKLMREALKNTQAKKFMGSDSDSLCVLKEETNKSAGDRISTILRMQLGGAPIQGDNTLEGNEKSLSTFVDNLLIDQVRTAVRSGGKMSEQRIPFSVREEAMMALKDYFAGLWDQWFFNQLSGNTAVSDTSLTGNNSTVSPSGALQIFAGSATAESNLSQNASQTFSLAMIDKCVLKARTVTPVIRPLSGGQTPGQARFVMFISPEQHYDLRRNTATLEWADIQKFAAKRGGENPLFDGSIGMYNGVVLHESYYLPYITTGSGANTGFRSVFCGAQAAVMAFGRDSGKNTMDWVEKLFDYDNQLGVKAGFIGGLKKTVYNSLDFGAMVASSAISTDAAAANGR